MNTFSEMWKEFVKQFITRKGYINVLEGLGVTVEIAVLGLLIGILVGTLIAVARVMPKYKLFPRILDKICGCYVELFRGTPMVVQLLIGYWVLLPALDIQVNSGVPVAIIVFGLNSGAYVSEIMRGGINSVDAGQMEAGRAVGLPYSTSMMKIVVPQAVKNILPTLGNEFIVLIKETSIVSFITVVDVTKALQNISAATYEPMVPYAVLAVIYLILVIGISQLVKLLERRMSRDERRN
jgi:polar amino acid transport system permease protein